MDGFDLPDDLKDDVEIVYLEEEDEIEGMDDFDEEIEENEIEREVIDTAKLTFRKHQGSVFSCDISKDGTMALTGGEDDMAYLWLLATGEVIMDVTGHKDSVVEVGFNHDDQYIVTGDMGGLMQVWNIKDKKLIWCYEGDDLTWLQWHHLTNVIISGTQAGDIYIFQIPQGNCKVLPSHGSPTNCGRLLPDGKTIVSGYADGQIKLWDIKATSVTWQYTHPEAVGVNSFEMNDDATLLCAAPHGHVIKLTDGKYVTTLLRHHETEFEMCAFNSELGLVATGGLSGWINVWEVGKQTLRHERNIHSSVTIMKFTKNSLLLIGATDGVIYTFDVRSGKLDDSVTGHEDGILSMTVSKDGSYVLSTSDDKTAKIFSLQPE